VFAVATAAWVIGLGFAGRHSSRSLLFDSSVDRILGRSTGPLHHAATLLSHVGDPKVFVTITAFIALALIFFGDYRAAATCVIGVTVADLLVEHVLKPFFDRRLNGLPNPSFPSGHAAVALALAGAVILAAGRGRPLGRLLGRTWSRLLMAVAFVLGCSVGLAMVVLQFHRMSDVLAGIPLGLAITGCTALIVDALASRLQPSNNP
jgi:undecaprenyl-diphosphatase